MSRLRLTVGVAFVVVAAGLPIAAATSASAAAAPVKWDFNDDGKADLAVGAPGEDVGSLADAGAVTVFLANSDRRLRRRRHWTQDSLDVPGAAEAGDQFGYALTSGDYNDDGYADLAIASNREDIGSGSARAVDSGSVTVLWGGPTGLTGAGSLQPALHAERYRAGVLLRRGLHGQRRHERRRYGRAGGRCPRHRVRPRLHRHDHEASFGTAWTSISETSTKGTKRAGDLFGESMTMGDFNNDGKADLAVGAPYDSDDTRLQRRRGRGRARAGRDGAGQHSSRYPLEPRHRWGHGRVAHLHRQRPAGLLRPHARRRQLRWRRSDDLVVGVPGIPLARTTGGALEDAGRSRSSTARPASASRRRRTDQPGDRGRRWILREGRPLRSEPRRGVVTAGDDHAGDRVGRGVRAGSSRAPRAPGR